ncbi:MBL fold metallo-hydrolase [Haloprofundus halobius]|uniref:MBL fold metallo-hydrolase n=1 Tax=Haloprofundus halobius TaxID=2876194 RepID=UPI001CCDDDBB|nr:MBL fold metallo-hydrolase [Haloprofundus halobius]
MSTEITSGDDHISANIVSKVSFHHVNVDAGNESILLRFGYEGHEETVCVLVDAGENVNLDSVRRTHDSLAAVCLTHAHADHYQSIGEVVEGDVPILTSPSTAAILDTVLTSAREVGFVSDVERLAEAVIPIDEWTDVAPGVRVHPVPAGHAPGAVGFVVRFRDANGKHDILFTGDFTLHAAGGYPSFDPGVAVDAEAMFLSVATADAYSDELTDGIGQSLERAHGGARVLVTAGGLQSTHLATLIRAVTNELTLNVPVRIVGQAAKLYDELGYDVDGVQSIPEFERTKSCLEGGVVTIAGPDVPTEGSAGRLYGAIRDDPNACLVQFVSSGTTPVSGDGQCATFEYRLSMHPTGADLDAVVETIDPIELITLHEHGGGGRRYNDWNSCVWSHDDNRELPLFEDGRWLTPPWMDSTYAQVGSRAVDIGHLAGDAIGDVSLASLDREETIDPSHEGIDISRICDRLHLSAQTTQPTSLTSPKMTNSTDDKTNRSTTELYMTVGAKTDSAGTLSTDSLAPKNLIAARARASLAKDDTEQESDSQREADKETSTRGPVSKDEVTNTETAEDGVALTEEAETSEKSTDESFAETDTERSSGEPTEETTAETRLNDPPVVAFEIDPLLLALAEQGVGAESVDAFVAKAMNSYLEAIIRAGTSPEGTVDSLDMNINVGERLGNVLSTVTAEDDSVSTLVRTALTEMLGEKESAIVEIAERDVNCVFVDAAVENPEYGFETRSDFVDAAVLWALDG